MSRSKKKLGYSQYEKAIADHDYKLELLAQKYNELQTYFLGFIEFTGKSLEFHHWMNDRIKETQEEMKLDKQPQKEESVETL